MSKIYRDIMQSKKEWAKEQLAKESYKIIEDEILEDLERFYDSDDYIVSETNDDESYNIILATLADCCINGVTFTTNEIEVNQQTVVFYYNYINEQSQQCYTSVEVDHEDFNDVVFYGFIQNGQYRRI